MRTQTLVSRDVDVSLRANNAAGRTGSNGEMQGTLHRIRRPKKSWYQRLQEYLPDAVTRALPSNWEHVTVNKQVESVTMPKWIAVGLLGGIILIGVQSWNSSTEQAKTLVRIETELRLAKESNLQKEVALEGALRDLNSWRGIMDGRMLEIRGMLSQQQLNALDRLQNKRSNQQQSQ